MHQQWHNVLGMPDFTKNFVTYFIIRCLLWNICIYANILKKLHCFQEAFLPPCVGWAETLHTQWKRVMHILTAQVTISRSGRSDMFCVGLLITCIAHLWLDKGFLFKRNWQSGFQKKRWVVLKSNRTTTKIINTASLLKILYQSSYSVRIITRITRTSTVPKLKWLAGLLISFILFYGGTFVH